MDSWDALQRTPIPELRRRAALVEHVDEYLEPSAPENGLFVWADGGGQHTAWQFAEDGRALLLTFDHEQHLNVINEELSVQQRFYDGVPQGLLDLVHRVPGATGFLDFHDDVLGTVIIASGVFWFDGRQWQIANGLADYCHANDIALSDVPDFSGFDYCTHPYLLGQDFTADTYYQQVGLMDWMKEPERTEVRTRIDAGFAAYGE